MKRQPQEALVVFFANGQGDGLQALVHAAKIDRGKWATADSRKWARIKLQNKAYSKFK
jgi:hypothetical protein